jgi:hypothetical protein
VYISGAIKESIPEIGSLIKWMEKASLYGLINVVMKEATKKIRKKAMAFLNGSIFIIPGMMAEFIKASGRMANNTVKESFIRRRKEFGKKAFGMMGKGQNGKTPRLINNFFNYI